MRTKKNKMNGRWPWTKTHVLVLGALCVMSSFALGIETAGDVQTFTPIRAAATSDPTGDMDGDGSLTIRDAVIILEIAQEYQIPTAMQLQSDPNRDGRLTVDDALRILHDLASH